MLATHPMTGPEGHGLEINLMHNPQEGHGQMVCVIDGGGGKWSVRLGSCFSVWVGVMRSLGVWDGMAGRIN